MLLSINNYDIIVIDIIFNFIILLRQLIIILCIIKGFSYR
jgi:hypothetical protein